MRRFISKLVREEKGHVLPLALILMVAGSLTVLPIVSLAGTVLKGTRVFSDGIHGLLAAEAGVEYGYWCLLNGEPVPDDLPETINGMDVSLDVDNEGVYTLYYGEMIEAGGHSEYLSLTGVIVWDAGADAYKYTITVTWTAALGDPRIHLESIGARIPTGYTYQAGSAATFPTNLSNAEPAVTIDSADAEMLNWAFEPPLPDVSEGDPSETQVFYMTGSGDLDGDYTWVLADREDIGALGEISGTLYKISATAVKSGTSEVTAKIDSAVIEQAGVTTIVSWQVSK